MRKHHAQSVGLTVVLKGGLDGLALIECVVRESLNRLAYLNRLQCLHTHTQTKRSGMQNKLNNEFRWSLIALSLSNETRVEYDFRRRI